MVVATHDDRITQLADNVVELTPHLSEAQRKPHEVRLEAGQMLFNQGDPSDLVFLVEDGEVDIFRVRGDGAEEHLMTVTSGGYFGELGPILNLPRSASARASTAAVLSGMSVQQFRAQHPGKLPIGPKDD